MEIKLTVVELDLVKFSEKNEMIDGFLQTEGTEVFYRKIKFFVTFWRLDFFSKYEVSCFQILICK